MADRTPSAIFVAISFLALSAKAKQKLFTQYEGHGIACDELGYETPTKARKSRAAEVHTDELDRIPN
jgi:hypothetical protein